MTHIFSECTRVTYFLLITLEWLRACLPRHPCAKICGKKRAKKYKRLQGTTHDSSHSNMADEVATAEETQKAEEEVQNSSKDESKEPATVTGVVVKGVVNWFNVAKGFGELAFVASIPARAFFFLVRHGCGPRVPAGPPGLPSNELAAPNGNVTRRSRTSRTRRDAPRRDRRVSIARVSPSPRKKALRGSLPREPNHPRKQTERPRRPAPAQDS